MTKPYNRLQRGTAFTYYRQVFANKHREATQVTSWKRQAEVSLVVFEATGVYHRLIETSLTAHDFPFARVNPRQARRFAEGTGTLAKTDRADAAMLGSLLDLKADKSKSETLHNLKGMETARQALIKDRMAAIRAVENRNLPAAQETSYSAFASN